MLAAGALHRVGWLVVVLGLIALTAGWLGGLAGRPASDLLGAPAAPEANAAAPADATATTGVAAVSPADGGAEGLPRLRAQALAQLANGDFQKGFDALSGVLRQAPGDPASVQARQWISSYLLRRTDDEVQRKAEYGTAAARAQALLAVSRSTDAAAKVAQIRDQVARIRRTYTAMMAAPLDESLYTGADGVLERMKADLATLSDCLVKSNQPIADESAAWARTLRETVAKTAAALEALSESATKQSWASLPQSESSLEAIRPLSEKFAEAGDDLGMLTSDTPLRAALDQLLVIKKIVPTRTDFLNENWAAQIVSDARGRAKELAEKDDWYKGLALYSTLSKIYEDDRQYKQEYRRIGRHARVLALYGPPEAASQPATAPSDGAGAAPPEAVPGLDLPTAISPEKPARWKEVIAGVDTKMVRQAIGQLEDSYVENVNYREVVLGGLTAIRVLAETPQLAATFPGLADKKARDEFLKGVDRQIEQYSDPARKDEAVEQFGVSIALDAVHRSDDATVKIPSEVIDLEFADGMMQPLDEFSSMIWPYEWPDFKKQTMGSFFGVGIQIQVESGILKVVSPLKNSPAYHAGIKAGDTITAIDGKSAKGIESDEAVKRITGPKGTQVVLTIRRPGQKDLFDKTLTRDEIRIQTVKGWKPVDGDKWDWMIDPESRIAYARIASFTKETPGELHEALMEMKERGARGLILDLRYNPGGLLQKATEVADEFLRRGRIVSTWGRQQPRSEITATEGGEFLDGEMVVLINELSASAAEIVSGALKDWKRAVIVGVRSYGKGSVQNLIAIRNDQAYLKLTTAYYYLPEGRKVHRTEGATVWGVEPDIAIYMSPQETNRWMDLRRRTEIIENRDPSELDKQLREELRADVQLDAAEQILRLRLLEKPAMEAQAARPTSEPVESR